MLKRIESDALIIERLENDDLLILDKEQNDFQLNIEFGLVSELLLSLEALYSDL